MQQNPLKNFRHKNFTIKSNKLCEIINQFRLNEGNKPKEHFTFMRDMRDEVNKLKKAGIELGENKFVLSSYKSKQNKEISCYIVDKDFAFQMLNRESAYVRMQTSIYIDELEQRLYNKSL